MYYDDDADLSLLDGKTVAIIGFGSQGHAHAQNLKDSGVDVVVGLRPDSASVQAAKDAGLEVLAVADAASRGDVVMVLVPDELHHDVWNDEVADGVAPGNLVLFGHGFSVHYGEVEPPEGGDGCLLPPQGPRHPLPPPTPPGASTSASSRPRAPATSSAASTSRARACRA